MKKAKFNITLIIYLITNLYFTNNSFSQIGTLDSNFNVGDTVGRYEINNQIQVSEYYNNGQTLIAGTFTNVFGINKNNIARINSDGKLDLTFDCGSAASGILGMKVVANGKIYVYGSFTSFNGIPCGRIIRLNIDGTVDNTFAPTSGADGNIVDLTIQNDGKIVIIGDFANFNGSVRNKITRVNANGSIDGTFNPVGPNSGTLKTIAITNDQKLLIGGSFSDFSTSGKIRMVRLNSNGSVDATFSFNNNTNIDNLFKILFYDDTTYVVSYIYKTTGYSWTYGSYSHYYRRICTVNNLGVIKAFYSLNHICSGSYQYCGPCNGNSGYINDIKKFANGNVLTTGTNYGNSRAVFSINMLIVKDHNTIENSSAISILPDDSYFYFKQTELNSYEIPRIAKFKANNIFDKDFYLNTAFSQRPSLNNADKDNFFAFGSNNSYFNNEQMGFKVQSNGNEDTTFLFTYPNIYNNLSVNPNSNFRTDRISDAITLSNNKNLVIYSYENASYYSCGNSYPAVKYKTLSRRDQAGTIELSNNYTSGNFSGINKLLELSDGSVIGYGSTIVKFNTLNFTTVSGFNTGSGPSGVINRCLELKNGQYLILGSFTSFNGTNVQKLALLNTNGTYNNSLNAENQTSIYEDAIELSDGRIILVGNINSYGINPISGIVAINPNGTIDNSTFITTGFTGGYPVRLIKLPDDRFYALGTFTSYNGTNIQHAVLINPNGSIDTTFTLSETPDNGIFSAILNESGDLILAGDFEKFNTTIRNKIAKIIGTPFISAKILNDSICNNDSIYFKVWVGGGFNMGNNFTIDISDKNGNFGSPTTLYTGALNNGVTFLNYSAKSFPTGTGYKLRITSTLPNLVLIDTDSFAIIDSAFIFVQPSPLALCEGDSANLFASVSGINLSYQWYHNGVVLPGKTDSTLLLNNVSIANQGYYILYINSTCGDIFTDSVFVSVNKETYDTLSISQCNFYTSPSGSYIWNLSGIYNDTIMNIAGCDSVITINLTINNSNTGIDSIIACDSYTWIDGNTYTSSTNSPTYTLINQLGCDSVVTLSLTIKNSNTGIDAVIACDSYTWIDGNTYTSSTNVPTYTLTNQLGCDSVVTLNLTINNSNIGTDVITACDSFTWIDGNTYTSSTNVPTYTLTNQLGCDSVVTLNLTINYANTGAQTTTSCNSYTWPANNNTYTSSGIYTTTLTNISGCDSVVTLNLTINYTNTGSQSTTSCDSYTWPANNNTYTNSGIYTATLTNIDGCDSLVTLNLTINYANTATDIITACDNYTWIDGITYTSSTNLPTYTLTNYLGCDSLVTLNLTINYANTATDIITACDSYTWIDGITYTSSTNLPTYTLTNYLGCDSIVTLNLNINYTNTGIQNVVACENYISPSGNYNWTVSGNYIDTIPNFAGCDSVITINLTVNYASVGTQTITACNSYNSPSNKNTWTVSGTYIDTIPNYLGCDSIITINLTINTVDTSVTLSNNTLIAIANIASYEWIDCSNNYVLIPGETSQTFTPSLNGSYAVIVTQNNCADTSACYTINNVGINEPANHGIKIYPNPSKGILHIETNLPQECTFYNSLGMLVYENKLTVGLNKIILSDISAGIYFVKLNNGIDTFIERVMIHP